MPPVSVRVARIAIGAGFLGAWQWLVDQGIADKFFFSRPSDIASRVVAMFGDPRIWGHLGITLAEAALAFGIGGGLGVVIGFVLARRRWWADVFEPYLRIANALPRVVLAPIFLLWFGLGLWSKVFLGVTVVFFVVFFNTFQGVRQADPLLLNNVRMLGASERQLTRHVLIPSALTWIFSSLQLSLGFALVAVVVGEYLGSARGIGYLIAQAEGVFDTTGVFAGLTVLSAVVLAAGGAMQRLERWLLRWKPESQR